MKIYFNHTCGTPIVIDSEEYPEFFEKEKLGALTATCEYCKEPISITSRDIESYKKASRVYEPLKPTWKFEREE